MAKTQKVSLEVIYIGPDDFTLPYILKEEGIKYQEEALDLICELADGSF